MFAIIISLTTILIVFFLFYYILKFSKKAFNPSKEEVYFKIVKDKLLIKSDRFRGIYEIDKPDNIQINNNDKIAISYNYNRGYLTGINEIYLNDKLILSKEQIRTLNLKMLLGD